MKQILGFSFLIISTFAQAEVTRQVSVSGHCLKKVLPDRGIITVVPTALDKSAQAALQKASKQYEALRAQVKALNLKDAELQTTEYSVAEQKEWDERSRKQISRGFRARFGLSVSTSELTRIGEVVAVATKLNIEEMSSFSTHLSAELSKKTHEACLQEAVKNAKEKAEKMLSVLGVKTGKLISIEENPKDRQNPPVEPYMMKEMAADSVGRAQISGVEVKPEEVSVNVAVVFGID